MTARFWSAAALSRFDFSFQPSGSDAKAVQGHRNPKAARIPHRALDDRQVLQPSAALGWAAIAAGHLAERSRVPIFYPGSFTVQEVKDGG